MNTDNRIYEDTKSRASLEQRFPGLQSTTKFETVQDKRKSSLWVGVVAGLGLVVLAMVTANLYVRDADKVALQTPQPVVTSSPQHSQPMVTDSTDQSSAIEAVTPSAASVTKQSPEVATVNRTAKTPLKKNAETKSTSAPAQIPEAPAPVGFVGKETPAPAAPEAPQGIAPTPTPAPAPEVTPTPPLPVEKQ